MLDCRWNDIEDVYPLSPLQRSLLHESISAPAGARIGLLQLVWDLPEAIKVDAFEQAWSRVVARHPIFRTRLTWTDPQRPLQEVVRHVRVPFQVVDWSALGDPNREDRLRAWLADDRRHGLDLGSAPLCRVAVLRFGPSHHGVVLTLHHVTFDGRTLLALIQEVFAVYEAACRGEEIELPPARPFRLYIEWLARQDRQGAEDFWQETLRGLAEPTPLGIDRPGFREAEARPARTGEVWFTDEILIWLSEAETGELLALAGRRGLTLNTLLLAAWSLLLSLYSGRREVLFGVVRTHRGALGNGPPLLGPVMSSVPFRGSAPPGASLGDWLAAVRAHWLEMRAGDFATLADIRGWSEMAPQAPLFESLVLFETHELTERLRQGGEAWRNRSFRLVRQTRMPLNVYGYQERRLALKVIFDPDRFDRPAMQRLLGHLRAVLAGMPSREERTVAELPLLTGEEMHQLRNEWNDTARPHADTPVHRRIEAQACRMPDAVALADPTGSWTYRELDDRANRLARWLAGRGVGAGSIAATCLPRSGAEVLAALAVLKAGGAYLPCDSAAPAAWLESILEDAGVSLLLTESALAPGLPAGAPRFCLDRLAAELSGQPEAPLPGDVSPDQPAYVIYTSGSSGRPKGVAVTHRSLANLVSWHAAAFQVAPRDRASRLAGLSFDAAVWELWPPLACGAAVAVPPEEARFSPEALQGWMLRNEVTVCFAPTPMAELLLRRPWPAAAPLRLLLTGGDTLHTSPKPGLPFTLVNNYGPTENTVVTTSGKVAARDADVGRPSPPAIGRPIDGVQVLVLSPDLRPVPIGVSGEICIAGRGLAQGYLGRPERTAASFVPHPASAGERVYRTGDLARFLPDGAIEFLGRRDTQVKVLGFRVELGEIEAALGQHPAVVACAVVARPGGPAEGTRLVAFHVGKAGAAADPEELREHLLRRLPPYMVPTTFAPLPSLPVTARGKIDRRVLAARAAETTQRRRDRVQPRTALERLLAQLWEEVLGEEEVGVEDDFFALGGQSLKGVQVVSFLREHFGCDASLEHLFSGPTIARLGATLFPSAAERARAERIAELTLDVSRLGEREVEDLLVREAARP